MTGWEYATRQGGGGDGGGTGGDGRGDAGGGSRAVCRLGCHTTVLVQVN